MDSVIGKAVSHYRVLERIASGETGVVYAARDEHLRRDVLLKLLPPALATDPRWLERLRHEARTLAAIRHPNIAAIHDLGVLDDGTHFLVLESMEGITLAERLRSGPLAPDDALRLCGDIARALQAAHEHRVLHRDLKPASVMVTPGGEAKVLDFGLAERSSPAADVVVGGSATATTRTQVLPAGAVSGTVGYMSPERARGLLQGPRSDIFAFGCVLFECLTARPPFTGRTLADVIAALLTREPDWTLLPPRADPRIRRILERCLQKDPQARWPSAGDLVVEIDAARDAARGPGLHGTSSHSRGGLPRQLTSFIGRRRELAECAKRLKHARLLTLVGPGGCGKTRLALRLAEQTIERFPDGTWLVDFAPVSEVSQVPRAVAAALALREEAGKTVSETIADSLRDKRALLILDNCEHLVKACAELAESTLRRSPAPHILATSREPLGVIGEAVWPVPALPVPDETCPPTARALGRNESVRLFRDRAVLYQPGFRLTDKNAGAVAGICRRLDGIPLALELAAARIGVLTPGQIHERLDHLFRLLGRSSRSPRGRHATLEATIDWSYELLAREEQECLVRLAAFSGGWTLTSATAVARDDADEMATLDLLTRLVDKSLVHAELHGNEETRYRFLETVRQFSLERLERSGDEEMVRDRHLDHFLALAEVAGAGLRGSAQSQWLRRLESEHENLLAALAWCGRSPDRAQKGLRLAGSLWRFWNTHGRYTTARSQLGTALGRDGAEAWTVHRAAALLGLGIIESNQGEPDLARGVLEESLTIFRAVRNAEGEGRALNALGSLANDRGDYEAARSLFQGSLAACREISDRRGIAIALGNLGHIASQLGDLAAARTYGEESLAHIARVGDEYSLAISHLNLAGVLRWMGESHPARTHLAECLRIVLRLEDPRTGAYALEFAGLLALEDGRTETAARLCGAARTLRSRSGIPVPSEVLEDQRPIVDRTRCGPDRERHAAAWASGEASSLSEAIHVALEDLGTAADHASAGS